MARTKSQIVTILEGRWFPTKNVSVRDLLLPLFTISTPNGDGAHHFEMFTNAESFIDAVGHAFKDGRAQTIYIAAHGTETRIQGFHDEGISRTKIRNAFRNAKKSQRLRGVYFGSCLFGTRANAELILKECPRVAWVVGYSESVDWIDSSVIDLFFLRHYLFPQPGWGRSNPTTQAARIAYAVRQVRERIRDLAQHTGFHAYVRKRGRTFGIRDLFSEGND